MAEHQVAEEGTGGHADHGSGQAPSRVCGERPGDEAAGQVDVGGGKAVVEMLGTWSERMAFACSPSANALRAIRM
jgi:hypothetical protein